MYLKNKCGQSLLEYSVLFAVVLSALLIMQFYLKRGYQGRLKKEADTVGEQYSPGHTTSVIITNTNSTSTTRVEDGKQHVTVTAGTPENPNFVIKNETIDSYAKD
jgi:uncharacterized protein (UPF0333 family)